jgi:hypothetical protein
MDEKQKNIKKKVERMKIKSLAAKENPSVPKEHGFACKLII